MVLTFLDRYRDFGLLILRIGIGIAFLFHGFPKLVGGADVWARLGENAGLAFAAVPAGFIASFAEFFGGICLILGFMMRPMLVLLLGTMIGASYYHITAGSSHWHSTELAILFFSLMFIGPGTYSLDERFKKSGQR
ncbi:MAG: DoxX family protein [Bacteroidota bacterium]